VLTIGLNRAISLLAEPKQQRRGGPTLLRVVGPHPADNEPINLYSGRYGPYVSHGGVNATVRDTDPNEVTVQQAVDLLAARPQPQGKRRAAKAKAAPKAKTESAPPAEKPASKKGAAAAEAKNAKSPAKKPAAKKRKKAAAKKPVAAES
jgi:DNA topoisomerase I